MSGAFHAGPHDLGHGLELDVPRDGVPLEGLGSQFSAIEPWSRYGITAESLQQSFSRDEPGRLRFGISHEGALIGLVIVQPSWLRGSYVPFLGLLPDAQGRGVGAAVLRWIAAETARFGSRNTWIAVSDFNRRARTLYERHGYIAVANIPDLIIDGRTEILMRKRL